MAVSQALLNLKDENQINDLREQLLTSLESGDNRSFAENAQRLMAAAKLPLTQKGEGAITVSSAINGAEIYSFKPTTLADYKDIKQNAEQAFQLLSKIPVKGKQAILQQFYETLVPYQHALNLIIALDTGKPVKASEFKKAQEWAKAASSTEVYKMLTSYSIHIHSDDPEKASFKTPSAQKILSDDSLTKLVIHQQRNPQGLGVCGATCGFNYPVALIMQDVVHCIVTGNALIAKPTEKCPAVLNVIKMALEDAVDKFADGKSGYENQRWYKQAQQNGVDMKDPQTLAQLKNMFQTIYGVQDKEMVKAWVQDSKNFRFVGSKFVGEQVIKPLREEVDRNLDHTILELAGNTPVVIMPSVTQSTGISKAVSDIFKASESNAGQRCTGPHRLFVHQDVFEETRTAMIEKYQAANNNIGNPLERSTEVGAIDKQGYLKAAAFLEDAKAAGAKVYGGERILSDKFPEGYYMRPALVDWSGVPTSKQKMIHEDEIFAPVVNLVKVRDLNHAIELTNLTNDNLSASIYTNSNKEVNQYVRGTNLGSVLVNETPKDLSPYNFHTGKEGGGIGLTGGLKSFEHYFTPSPSNHMIMLNRKQIAKGVERADAVRAQRARLNEMVEEVMKFGRGR